MEYGWEITSLVSILLNFKKLFCLLGVNVSGVKWVIRLQLVLLLVLFLSIMDLLVGSFVHTAPGELGS